MNDDSAAKTIVIAKLANKLCQGLVISDASAQLAIVATLEEAYEAGRASAAKSLDPTPPDPG